MEMNIGFEQLLSNALIDPKLYSEENLLAEMKHIEIEMGRDPSGWEHHDAIRVSTTNSAPDVLLIHDLDFGEDRAVSEGTPDVAFMVIESEVSNVDTLRESGREYDEFPKIKIQDVGRLVILDKRVSQEYENSLYMQSRSAIPAMDIIRFLKNISEQRGGDLPNTSEIRNIVLEKSGIHYSQLDDRGRFVAPSILYEIVTPPIKRWIVFHTSLTEMKDNRDVLDFVITHCIYDEGAKREGDGAGYVRGMLDAAKFLMVYLDEPTIPSFGELMNRLGIHRDGLNRVSRQIDVSVNEAGRVQSDE